MSQPEVAKIIGVTTDTVTNWELNRNEPTAKYARKILEFMAYVPLSWFNGSSIGQQLKNIRMVRGMTTLQISKELNLDATTVRMIENFGQSPSKKTRMRIKEFIDGVHGVTSITSFERENKA